jgi:hypothetical protein
MVVTPQAGRKAFAQFAQFAHPSRNKAIGAYTHQCAACCTIRMLHNSPTTHEPLRMRTSCPLEAAVAAVDGEGEEQAWKVMLSWFDLRCENSKPVGSRGGTVPE